MDVVLATCQVLKCVCNELSRGNRCLCLCWKLLWPIAVPVTIYVHVYNNALTSCSGHVHIPYMLPCPQALSPLAFTRVPRLSPLEFTRVPRLSPLEFTRVPRLSPLAFTRVKCCSFYTLHSHLHKPCFVFASEFNEHSTILPKCLGTRLPVCSLWGWRGDRQRCSKATCM